MQSALSPRRRLLLYAGVAALTRSGSSGLYPAVLLAAIAAGDGVARGSIILACFTGVGAVCGPFIGALIGRERHPKAAFIASIAVALLGVVLLAIGIAAWPMHVLLPIAALIGLAYPALTGGWSGQVRRIAPEIAPSRAYAVDVGTYNVADVVGPALVGAAAVIDVMMPGSAVLEVVALMYAAGLLLLVALHVPERGDVDGERESLRVALQRLRVVTESPALLRSVIVGTVSIVATGAYIVAMPQLGVGLAGEASVGAVLLSVTAAGALLGSGILTRVRIPPAHVERWMFGGVLGMALCFVALAAAPSVPVAAAILAVLGLVQAPMLTSIFTLRDRESPEAARSIVFVTAASLRTAGFSLGTLLGAVLAAGALTLVGWRATLLACAVVAAAAALLAVLAGARRVGSPRPD